MNCTLRFLPEVEDDGVAAYTWYEKNVPGLGDEFLRTFYTATEKLVENPFLYPTLHTKFRRRLLPRFPYAMYYSIDGNQIIVLGLFHCARDPHGVQTTLQNRNT